MTRSRWIRLAMAIGLAAGAAGCVGPQSVLDPAGTGAERIAHVWWLDLAITAGFYVAVLVAAAVALARSRGSRGAEGDAVLAPSPSLERGSRIVVGAALAIAFALLVVLMVADMGTRRGLGSHAPPVIVQVTGHQWWWNFQYQDPVPARMVTSPNALHLPVGVDVRLDLVSHDVVHSLWMPNFTGKRDLVPGHPSQMVVHATRAGTFSGQCAEFCGMQHATMRFTVIAEPRDAFERWLEAQRQNPGPPATPEELRGQQVFLGSTCVMCHAIRGTTAASEIGPDLTHVGSRPAIASATLPNVRSHLEHWIAAPGDVRPGVLMPPHPMPARDLSALAGYLASLK